MKNDPPCGGSFFGWGYCFVALSVGSFDYAQDDMGGVTFEILRFAQNDGKEDKELIGLRLWGPST
jgi:hypothetical protein